MQVNVDPNKVITKLQTNFSTELSNTQRELAIWQAVADDRQAEIDRLNSENADLKSKLAAPGKKAK